LKPAGPREDRWEKTVSSFDDAWRRRQVDELFRAHGDFLRRLAAQLCRATLDPDDLVQDVFERTMQHVHVLQPEGDHRAWLARVMRNMFVDGLRRRAATPAQDALEDDVPAPGPDSREWWEKLDAEDIRARMTELPDELRGAFELFVFEGCSYAEIASRLGIPKMTVGTRILRGRRRLKQLFVAGRAREGIDD